VSGLNICKAKEVLAGCYQINPETVTQTGQSVFRCRLTDGRTLFLKAFDPIFTEKAPALGRLYSFISDRGLTPRLLPDCNGQMVTEFDGTRLILQLSAETRHAVPQTGPDTSPEVLASALARLHETLRNFSEASALHSHLEQSPSVLSDFARQLGLEGNEAVLHRAASDPQQLIHGDLHPANVLAYASKVTFLDFDSTCVAPPRREAAFAAHRLFQIPKDQRRFLEAYARETKGSSFLLREMYEHLFHITLSRIHFILMSVTRHETRFLYDLLPQMQRLGEIRQALTVETVQ